MPGRELPPAIQAERSLAEHWREIISSSCQEDVILEEPALQKIYSIYVKRWYPENNKTYAENKVIYDRKQTFSAANEV